ncbi:MAG: class I SAM-dependent methyltransferase [Chitinophagaceae bacterium]
MYSRWQLAKQYLQYYYSAANSKGHGVHSPFVYDFIRQVLNDERRFYAYYYIEQLRTQLLANEAVLDVEDLGAGSVTTKTRQRSVASIAEHAAKPKKWAQLLFRIVHYYQPQHILELGTSLGVSTAYMSLANPNAQIITGEGSKEVAAQARKNFGDLFLNNVELVEGNFDDTLPAMIKRMPSIDLAFVDGNHRYEPTMRYFHQLLPAMSASSMIIFDDIHWSEEMLQAWTEIQQHPSVMLTVDLFFIGLVFFRDDFKIKQHFAIRH